MIVDSVPIQISSAIPMLIFEQDTTLLYASAAAYKLLQRRGTDEDLRRELPEEIIQLLDEYFSTRHNTSKLMRFQRYVTIDKELRKTLPLELNIIAITYTQHDCVVLLMRDISPQLRQLESLDLSDERFRILVENLCDIAVTWMSTPGVKKMLYVNKGYENIWGRSCDSLYKNPRSFIELVHPEDKQRVIEHLQAHTEGNWNIDYRILRDDGELRHIHDSGRGVYNAQGKLEYLVGTAIDVTVQVNRRNEIEKYMQRIEHHSRHDDLTEIYNRRTLLQLVRASLENYKRYKHQSSLVFIDVTNLNYINKHYGHEAGDILLHKLSNYFIQKLRGTDMVGRYGGDEFILILKETPRKNALNLLQEFTDEGLKIHFNGSSVPICFDFGVAAVDERSFKSIEEWIGLADTRMCKMKNDKKELYDKQ